MHQAIAQKNWITAEGALLRLLALVGEQPSTLDALGYVLLMQGSYIKAQAVLEKALCIGSRSFWTSHKLADSLVGQQKFDEAIAFYERALVEGSNSPLTVRNLLSSMEKIESGMASSYLYKQPLPLPLFWIEGVAQAARMLASPRLATWLLDHGYTDPWLASLVWRSALLRMDTSEAVRLVSICGESSLASAWKTRLQQLLSRDKG